MKIRLRAFGIAKDILKSGVVELDEDQISEREFLDKLEEKQISIIGMGQGKLRMVTHLDYTDEMHSFLLKALIELE